MKEVELQVSEFGELTKFLNLFSIIQTACQMDITTAGIQVFGKFTSGRCDLYSASLSISQMTVDPDLPKSITVFIPDIKKFIYTLDVLGKYYDLSDNAPFITREIRMFVAADSSYFRIMSNKYTIKYQLASNAIVRSSIGDEGTYAIGASKYGTSAHEAFLTGKNLMDSPDAFLLAFRTGKKRIANMSTLLSTLSNSDNAMIKLEIPEQVAIEPDLTGADNTGMMVMPNTLYAILMDNQRLINTKLGNKVCVSIGDITNLSSDYKNHCRVDTLSENFVYNLSIEQLKVISSLLSSFSAAVETKAAKPAKRGKKAAIDTIGAEPELVPQPKEEGNIEVALSRINVMHLNLISTANNCSSEFYVSLVGMKAGEAPKIAEK